MDETLESFCKKITPSHNACEKISDIAKKLVQMLVQKSSYPIKRFKVVGGFNSKTSTTTSAGVDLLIYGSYNYATTSKNIILSDWTDVILLKTDLQPEDVQTSPCSFTFVFQGISFRLLLAFEYSCSLKEQQEIVVDSIRKSGNMEMNQYFEADLSEIQEDFIASQTEFTKDLVRLADYWNNSILWGKSSPQRSHILSLMAVHTGIEEQKKTSFPHHKKSFITFLQKVQCIEKQKVGFEQFYKFAKVPQNLMNQTPLVLDPANPYRNLCNGLPQDFYTMSRDCATTTLRMLDNGCEDMRMLFFPQPMLWKFLQSTRISFHPESYLISRHFYNKQVPSTIVRTRVNEQFQN